MTTRREFTAAIVACLVGAGLALLSLRQGWARVFYHAPSPLPSGSIPVTGWNILPAASGLAIAALACLAAIIATRGVARRVAGALMAVLGGWAAVVISAPVHAATVVAAASGATASSLGGTLPGGNSAISGNPTTGGSLPVIGNVTRVALTSGPWRVAALTGAVLLIAAGVLAAWRGPRWPVMSGRFDRPGQQTAPRTTGPGSAPQTGPANAASGAAPSGAAPSGAAASGLAPSGAAPPGAADQAGGQPADEPGQPAAAGAPNPDSEAAEIWEALDRGMDLTDTPAGTGPPGPPASHDDAGPGDQAREAGQPVAVRRDEP